MTGRSFPSSTRPPRYARSSPVDTRGHERHPLLAPPRRPSGANDLQEARIGHEQASVLVQRSHHAPGRCAADHVEDHVPGLGSVGEVIPGVVEDAVRADRAQHLQLRRAVHRGHVRPQDLGELDRERAEAPARSVDQDSLPAPDLPLAQERQCLASPVGYGRSVLVAQVRRHRRDRPGLGVLAQTDVLRVGSQPDARRREDTVTRRERPHVVAHRLDVTGELLPEHRTSRPA